MSKQCTHKIKHTICIFMVRAIVCQTLFIFVKSRFTQKQFNCKISQSNRQRSLVAEDYSLLEGNSRRRCHPMQALLFEQAKADVKYLSLNSNTQGHFSQIELSAFPLGTKRGGKILPSHLVIILEMKDRRG